MFAAQVLQVLVETGSHLHHAAGHHLKIVVPHAGECFVAENNVNDAGTVDWWD